jgi:hypothetical protein
MWIWIAMLGSVPIQPPKLDKDYSSIHRWQYGWICSRFAVVFRVWKGDLVLETCVRGDLCYLYLILTVKLFAGHH